MEATKLSINGINDIDNMFTSLDDFDYTEAGTVNAEWVIQQSNIKPYCLDKSNRRIILVETPKELDLSQEAFVFTSQRLYAKTLYSIPYEIFNKLYDKLPDPQKLVFIYSTGRCGSTLLHKAFGAAHGVISLSEPDIYTNLAWLDSGDIDQETLIRLLRNCTRILCQSLENIYTIKFRPPVINIANVIHAIFPSSKSIFLYRNARDTLNSYSKAFGTRENWGDLTANEIKKWSIGYPPLRAYIDNPHKLKAPMFAAIAWYSPLKRYIELFSTGIWTTAVRYEDLINNSRQIIQKLFEKCEISLYNTDDVLSVFKRDSQENTNLSRKKLAETENTKVKVKDLLEAWWYLRKNLKTRIKKFYVPGTIKL